MTHDEVDLLIGRAVTDRMFRKTLLDSPGAAIVEFPFTGQERDLITSIEAASLEDFAQQLIQQIETSPNGPRSPNGSGPFRGPWDDLAA